MDTTLIAAIAVPAIGAVAAIVGARYQARRASKDEIAAAVAEQTKALTDRVAAMERTVADLKGDCEALGVDMDGLRAAMQAESGRRQDAREAAARRDLEVVQKLTDVAAGVKAVDQRVRDVLDAAGGIRGLARTSNPG